MRDSNTRTLRLQVQGMSCAGCEQRIGTVLRRLDGVMEATADHMTGEVRLRFDPASTDRGAVADRIGLAGYAVEADTDTNNDTEPAERGGPVTAAAEVSDDLWAAEPSGTEGQARIRARIAGLHCSLCTGTIEKALGRIRE